MTAAPHHEHEDHRVRSLRALLALEITEDRVLDTVTSLACRLLDMPVSMVNVVDEDLQHSLAATGIDLPLLERDEAICPWTVAAGGYLSVPDLAADDRFRDGTVARAGLRSYHGSTVHDADGLPLGALCVLDRRPRTLGPEERLVLEDLASLATERLELLVRRQRDTAPVPVPVPPADGRGGVADRRPGHAATTDHASPPDDPASHDPATHDPAADLARGLAAGELVPWFQPIVSVADGRVVGVEALARWEHPTRGLLPPSEFLPVAERSGHVLTLDATMLLEACHQVQQWRTTRAAAADLELSVNVSGLHLGGGQLLDLVRSALRASGLPAHALTVELTETVLVGAGEDRGFADLRDLRRLGVGLALDDFGTAYSTLAYLRRFPVTRLKVDRSFVDGLGTDPRDSLLVESVVGLADRLGLDVVAEGVETTVQLEELRVLGCGKAQGYLFHRPVPAEELESSGRLGPARGAATIVCFPRPA